MVCFVVLGGFGGPGGGFGGPGGGFVIVVKVMDEETTARTTKTATRTTKNYKADHYEPLEFFWNFPD